MRCGNVGFVCVGIVVLVTSVRTAASVGELEPANYGVRIEGTDLVAENDAQKFRTYFRSEGALVAPYLAHPNTYFSFRLTAWGRDGAAIPSADVPPVLGACSESSEPPALGDCLRRVEYARPGLN